MTYRPDSSELNAYVDGELAPDRAARVAQAVAHDRDLAQEVAALLRLKTATLAAFDLAPPARPRMPEAADHTRMVRWLASAAAGLAVLLAAAVALLSTSTAPTDAERVLAVIDAWGRDRALPTGSRTTLTTAEAHGEGLASLLQGIAGLQLRVVRSQPVAHGMALDLIGPNGCRLAVWAGPLSASIGAAPAVQSRLGAPGAAAWQAAGTQFLLVSRNVPEQKFAAMALALQRATQGPSPTDSTTLSRVAEARSQGSPCLA